MWLLVIILLSPLTDAEQVILNSFTSYEECQPEGDRVGLELAESYPDKVFRIMCAFRASPEVLAQHISKGLQREAFLPIQYPSGNSPHRFVVHHAQTMQMTKMQMTKRDGKEDAVRTLSSLNAILDYSQMSNMCNIGET